MRTRARSTQPISGRFGANLNSEMTCASCKCAGIPGSLHNHAAPWMIVCKVEQLPLAPAPLSPGGNAEPLSFHAHLRYELFQALEGSTR